jgi:hypothetical protein
MTAMNRALGIFAACALAAMGSARAEIFRCTAAGGAVTYQEIPCAASEKGSVLEVPASYPALDSTLRDRLFAREAALDQRLEAQRERENRESIARLSQPAAPVADAEPDAPLYPIAAYRPRWHRAAPRHPFGNRLPNHG